MGDDELNNGERGRGLGRWIEDGSTESKPKEESKNKKRGTSTRSQWLLSDCRTTESVNRSDTFTVGESSPDTTGWTQRYSHTNRVHHGTINKHITDGSERAA